MMAFKNLWKRGMGSGDVYRPAEKDQHMVACDTLMSELDFHIKELSRIQRDQELEARKAQTGVDYSWLIESNPKTYEIPQMERLELEELCYKVSGPECTSIIALFRDFVQQENRVENLPYVMRSCVRKVLEERPVPETLTEWVAKRTPNLSSFKLRPPGKVMPAFSEAEDIEMQSSELDKAETRNRAFSAPNFTVSSEGGVFPS